jgi:hypothetical protein
MKTYTVNGEFHRANGPAVEWNYGQYDWWLFGERHRYYGPRGEYDIWYIHGSRVK